jgi:hypothetical protein
VTGGPLYLALRPWRAHPSVGRRPRKQVRRIYNTGRRPTRRHSAPPTAPNPFKVSTIADELDIEAMIERFRARARAVRQRGIPPLEGPDRKRFMDQARIDFQDYAIIGDAVGSMEDGVLTLTVDLRPKTDSRP